MKILLKFLFIISCCFTTIHAATTPVAEQVVEYARECLPLEGQLCSKSNGFVYLKVDDNYIHELLPLLELEDFKEPPYFRTKEAPGAHISVIYEDENVLPDELGNFYSFDLQQIVLVRTRDASYVVLQVLSPELEALRQKYGLKPKLQGHEFHISIAKKKTR